ncbi:SDR family oxidoreductase [Salinibacterium sp. SWN167]|uniref:SDR family oxidoreductase n=1 Tax=Salinibacterium sp. SWN167 TaxID=2792054 RepID=UPI0018CCA74E|nr:SDR family oxidoreductase [Salinibacterium sp. SWN167]MBH0082755.1 SDR family oxidoreductase [Salinibacterium sp. SWN167]
MTSLPTIAVTGSTGNLGSMVARNIADAGTAQRLLVRTPSKAPSLPAAAVSPFSYTDREATIAALEGVETVFMVSAPEGDERLDQHRTFIDAVRDAGVRHIVYTSFIDPSPESTFTLGRDHGVTEQYIIDAGLNYTFIRDNFYLDFMKFLVGDDGVIRGPGGDGRISAVAREDIARVIATVLQNPADHVNVHYDMTGPAALSLTEIADIMSAHLGKTITYHDETIEEAYASRASFGAPEWEVESWVSTYTAIASGALSGLSDAVEKITGRAPMSLAQVLKSAEKE